MKVADLVKLRWLVKCLDNLSCEDYDRVSDILEKSHRDPNKLNNQDLDIIEKTYLKTRQKSMN